MTDMTVAQIEEFLSILRQLTPDRREWFVDQLRRMDRGEPNAIEGTAPNPYAGPEEEAAAA